MLSRFATRVFLCFLPLLLLSACTTSPTSGSPIFTGLVSESKEQAIGADEHQKVLRQFGVNDTTDLNFFVARIGARLAPHAERKNVSWTFTVLDDDLVNAFALPGGYIYITRGLLALAQDESQVAAVLAHEMGHVNARHSAQQMSQGLLADIGIQAVGIATGSNLAAQLGGTGADLYLKSYSRAHEFEADALSVKYLAAAGYDPRATAHFLEQLDRSTQFEKQLAGSAAGGELFGYFATHPQTPDRVVRANGLATGFAATGETNRDSYLTAINGTAYGNGAKEGFIRGREFIHPKLKIRFTAPQGFILKNSPKAVIAENENGAAMIFDTARVDATDPASFLAGIWAANKPLTARENITVNGLNGATAATTLQTNEGIKDARLIALQGPRGLYYRLLFVAPQGQMGNYSDAFRRSTYSFVYDADLKVESQRVRVITVRSGDSVQSLAARMNVDNFPVERFCLMNGVSPNTKLDLGDQVKIVE